MSPSHPAWTRAWEADVVLRDGAAAHIRPIRPADADALQAFHVAQSPRSTYLRFFAPMPRLSPRDLARFTTVDHHDRVALVVLVGDAIIGVGRYDRVEDGVAEVAFNVSDAHQGRGVARCCSSTSSWRPASRGSRASRPRCCPRTARCSTSSPRPASRPRAPSRTAS